MLCKTKSIGSLKCALVGLVSLLKSISFVFKWRCVKSVLSPLSVKSYGGSRIFGGKEIGLHCGNVPVINNANCFLFQKAKYA